MTPELWQRLEPLYHAARELPEKDRAQFLAKSCGEDNQLRAELERLLKAADEKTSNFDRPLIDFKLCRAAKPALADGDLLLDRFSVVRFINAGGMGEVYEVEDRFLRGVHVALKTILPGIAGNPELQDLFEREVLLAREVSHSNLCPIYDIFRCEEPPPGLLFLTMKLLPGRNLAVRLREATPVSVEEGLAILKQMVSAVAAIHAAGIIHRDIKPNNVMIEGSGSTARLWITDFGLARAFATETTKSVIGKIAGTPGYIAPELLLHHPPSEASDLFALGVVLHEVFTGKKPELSPDGSSYTVSPKLLSSKIPALCVRLVSDCLSHDPQKRCRAFEETLTIVDPEFDPKHYRNATNQLWTRRRFAGTAAMGACAIAGGTWWKWDDVDNVFHPLPTKRFLALIPWPKTSNQELSSILFSVANAIRDELSRFEEIDKNLLAVTPSESRELAKTDRLIDICDTLGTNLVLAISGKTAAQHVQLLLQVLDPVSSMPLREKSVRCSLSAIALLSDRVVAAVASLLNIRSSLKRLASEQMTTHSPDALRAFQSAEEEMSQPNDSGLNSAIDDYKKAIEFDPRYASAHANLGLAYGRLYALKLDPAALELGRGNALRSLELMPNQVTGNLALASVLEQTGHEEDAVKAIAKALSVDPSNSRALIWQGQMYSRFNRWSDAEASFNRVLKLRPNYWLAYNELGVVLNHQAKYQEAINVFRAACLAAPKSSLAFNNLGAMCLQTGDFPAAVTNFKRSFALAPNDVAACNTSLALRYQGRNAEALPFALRAVDLSPNDDTDWLELADCYAGLGVYPKQAEAAYLRAQKEAEARLRTNPTDGPGWMFLALYQVKCGHTQAAFESIRKAEEHGGGDIDSQMLKARVLEVAGRRRDALAVISGCFRKGASKFQLPPSSDLASLQMDPMYKNLVRAPNSL